MAGDEEAKPETRWFRRCSPQVQLDKLRVFPNSVAPCVVLISLIRAKNHPMTSPREDLCEIGRIYLLGGSQDSPMFLAKERTKLKGSTQMSVKTCEETPDVENTDTSVTTVGGSSSSPTSKEKKKKACLTCSPIILEFRINSFLLLHYTFHLLQSTL
ncbi:unnamed protein product [Musa hybrid cultivar]